VDFLTIAIIIGPSKCSLNDLEAQVDASSMLPIKFLKSGKFFLTTVSN